MSINRRKFLGSAAAAGLLAGAARLPAGAASSATAAPGQLLHMPNPTLPLRRGFNLQWERHAGDETSPAFQESDFAAMQQWGFNFARIPLSYWIWGKSTDWSYINEAPLQEIDRVIALGKQHNVHVNLNFHRIPGYCINQREREPHDLFTDHPDGCAKALEAATFHWRTFARRYKGVPSSELSFDLINEPPKMKSYEGAFQDRYVEVAKTLVEAIREEDPQRLIFADGINIGQNPVAEFVPFGIVQSTRGYQPKAVSHYGATWVPLDEYESMKLPTWPLIDDKGTTWDRARLKTEYVEKYQPVVALGAAVHVGEWGCYNQTPHQVALAWMQDCLAIWKQANWGNALWNLRGNFGVLDSGRKDVTYEDFKGHKLDRKMLEILQTA